MRPWIARHLLMLLFGSCWFLDIADVELGVIKSKSFPCVFDCLKSPLSHYDWGQANSSFRTPVKKPTEKARSSLMPDHADCDRVGGDCHIQTIPFDLLLQK
jgi:hypothetical protein